MVWLAVLSTAMAAPAPEGMDVSFATEGELTSTDVEVFIRGDGQMYVGDNPILAVDLKAELERRVAESPDLRVVLGGDPNADRAYELQVIETARTAGVKHLAIETPAGGAAKPMDPLFPGNNGGATSVDATNATELSGLSKEQIRKLRPKRWKFPQDPYASTDFTAYTLEWGEGKIGLFGFTYGILPRVQLGTVPVADALGIWNANAKINAVRIGPLDGAILGQAYYVPFGTLVKGVDTAFHTGLSESVGQQQVFTTKVTYTGVGAMASLQVLKPWSLHAGVYLGRIQATGSYDLSSLPSILVPGTSTDLTGSLNGDLSPSVGAQLIRVNAASDVRFNRRDSIVVQASTVLAAETDAAIKLTDTQLISNLPGDSTLKYTYAPQNTEGTTWLAGLAYQASWQHIELRLGVGAGAPIRSKDADTGEERDSYNPLWILQTYEIAYRFGGETRRTERQIKKGFRRNTKDLKSGGDAPSTPASTAPTTPTEPAPTEPAPTEPAPAN